MSRRYARLALAFSLMNLITFASASIVLAAWAGEINGRDLGINGWIGSDNNDQKTGTYACDNIWQDASLGEWSEPAHDWLYDRFNRWGQAAEDKLDAEADTHGLGIEMRIHDQHYYDFTGNWNTNYPFSKGAENENPVEELAQGYTEVDTEIQDPNRIAVNTNYFIDYQLNSEKKPASNAPNFYTELEYCDNNFNNCNTDVTGWFRKKVIVQ